ncbi:hypothetical protein BRAO375_450009 [Bradyrhizobium sp. ORS 375]|nr:hypothetical protein BRAO375_450009 [Bradyrhizobium sp. ORS 375]
MKFCGYRRALESALTHFARAWGEARLIAPIPGIARQAVSPLPPSACGEVAPTFDLCRSGQKPGA